MWSAIIITRDIYVKSSDYLCELIPGLSGYDCINSVDPISPSGLPVHYSKGGVSVSKCCKEELCILRLDLNGVGNNKNSFLLNPVQNINQGLGLGKIDEMKWK